MGRAKQVTGVSVLHRPAALGQITSSMANPLPIIQSGPRLGQVGPTVNPGQAPPAPMAPGVPTAAGAPQGPQPIPCPGPLEMPDGHTLNPDDPVSLRDLCDLLPYLAQNLKNINRAARQQQGTGPVALVGQGVPYATVISPPSGFFGGDGGFAGQGQGGMAGFPGGGGGGPGPAGPPGPPGSPGIGAAPAFLTKVDGDFTAGPGSFVSVPGTQLQFNQAADGPAIFFLQGVFGCSGFQAQSNQIGLRLTDSNGVHTVFPLTVTLLHTGVVGVGVFFQPAPGMWPVQLSAGAYTVEVMLRGLSAGEFCSGSGLGFAAVVSANAQVPLALVAFHT